DAGTLGKRVSPENRFLLRPDGLHLRGQVADHRLVRHLLRLRAAGIHALADTCSAAISARKSASVRPGPLSKWSPRISRPSIRSSRKLRKPLRISHQAVSVQLCPQYATPSGCTTRSLLAWALST